MSTLVGFTIRNIMTQLKDDDTFVRSGFSSQRTPPYQDGQKIPLMLETPHLKLHSPHTKPNSPLPLRFPTPQRSSPLSPVQIQAGDEWPKTTKLPFLPSNPPINSNQFTNSAYISVSAFRYVSPIFSDADFEGNFDWSFQLLRTSCALNSPMLGVEVVLES